MIELACATLSAEGFADSNFEKTFALIPAAGFRALEVNLWFGRMLLPDTVARLAARCQDTGMRVAAVLAPGLGASRARTDVDVGHKLHVMDVMARLGCKRLVMGGTPNGRGGSLEAIMETLVLLVPEAARRGITLCLENHHNFTLDRIEDFETLCARFPDPHVGVCVDTGHFEASGIALDEVIDRLGDRINHLHVKENRTFGKKDFCWFGEGPTPNAHVIERMLARGYDGCVTVEQSPQPDRAVAVDDLARPFAMFARYATER